MRGGEPTFRARINRTTKYPVGLGPEPDNDCVYGTQAAQHVNVQLGDQSMKRVFFATAAALAPYYRAPEARRRIRPTSVEQPGPDHSWSPSVGATPKSLTSTGKIDAILKLSVVASVLLASSSVGYYYLIHLPHRDAQFEPELVLEKLRVAVKKHAEQEQLVFEQQASERRAAEQQVSEKQQALEKANRYQACLTRATDNYNASRLAACNRPREKIIKDRDDCIKLGFSEKVCAMAHVVRNSSPNCMLPRVVTLSLDADAEKARDRCLEQDRAGLQ
jgi:hypothetical protein